MADSKVAAAPVNEIGYSLAVNYNWWAFTDETTPELIWPQSISVYDQMRRQDAQVTSVLRAVSLPVRRTPWRIDPAGARAKVVQFVADDLGLPIVGGKPRKAMPRQRDRFSWADHLRLALLMLPFGHSYFEQVYRINEAGTEAHLKKLAYRPPQTIEFINVAQDGGLVSLRQYWVRTGEEPKPIPVDRLVAYVADREGGNWLGQSILRSAYKNWLLKDRLLRVQAQTIERNGMGVPLYTAAENESDLGPGLAMAKAWRSGESAGTALPNGATLVLRGVEGELPDAEPAIRYHDEQIARAVLAHFLNLGTQTGSWALGSTFADFFVASLQTLAEQIADTVTRYVIEDIVDLNFGPDEPAPCLTFDEIGSQQAPTAEALKLLFDAGAIRRDDPLENFMRQQYGLPPADPSTMDPAPPPDGLPASTSSGGQQPTTNPSPTGTYSVAAAGAQEPLWSDEPVRAGRHSFDPAERRDLGGQWTSGPVGEAKKVAQLPDKLKLKDTIQLGDGESFVGSSHFEGYDGSADMAFIDRGGQRLTRLAILGPRADDWDGSVDASTVVLSSHHVDALAGGLQAALQDLKVKQREYKQMFKRIGELADADENVDSPEYHTLFKKVDDLEHDAGVSGVVHGADGTQIRWYSSLASETGTPYLTVLAGKEGDDEMFLPGSTWVSKFIAKLRAGGASAPTDEEDDQYVRAAAGHDTHLGGEQLKHYWVYGEGAAKWSTWTELEHHLLKYMNPEMAKRTAAEWFHLRYGFWPGADVNRVKHGKPPRGHLVGPG